MKLFTGKVIGEKMQKTATVAVERVVTHPLYGKKMKISKKYQVHNEVGAKTGQKVIFKASKPYSKLKRWTIVKVLERDLPKTAKKKGVKK